MPQRVEFAVFPNTPERATLSTVNKVLGHAHRNPQMGLKQFREWLREQNLWDKETSPLVLELIGIQTHPKYQWTPFATQLYSAPDEPQQQQILFRRLRDENVLLAKYVLTSIDVDSGGRLHSSHELYRVLTSYVYPGAYITLPSFQAWIRWMQACDAIRYIGIRWGLGEVGKAAIPWLRSRDDDEILEDMADDDDGHPGDTVQLEPAAVTPAPVITTVPSPNLAGGPLQADSVTDEDLPDIPDEAVPPGVEVLEPHAAQPDGSIEPPRTQTTQSTIFAQRTSSAAARQESTTSIPPVTQTRPTVMPGVPFPVLGAVGHSPVRLLPMPLDAEALAKTAEWIRTFWVTWPVKKKFGADHFGIHTEQYDADRGLFLSKLAYLAVLVTETTHPAVVRGFWEKLSEVRFLERTWAHPESFSELLIDLDFFADNPVYAKLAETLVYSLAFQVRVRKNAQWAEHLDQVLDGRTLSESLGNVVYRGAFHMAPFWVIGQLVSLGLMDRPEIRTMAIVPTYRLRENAYRLGFVDSLYAESLPAWFSSSEAISHHFGPNEGFGDALEAISDHLGCSFNCGKVYVCPLSCREKIGR